MAYGAHRFLSSNLITDAGMITTSSKKSGRVSAFTTTQSGSADWRTAGSYTGDVDLLITVQIDSVSAGAEIGSATFRWKTSETASGWEASGVTTSTSYLTLQDGIQVAWGAGTGADFVVNDEGVFWVYAQYAGQNLIDNDRNIVWQATNDTAENVVIDLGTAQSVTAIVIGDHNFTSLATVKLEANSSNSWTSPAYSLTLSVTSGFPHIYAYFAAQSYRYWRVTIADSTNPAGYVQIGELYLGTYTQLSAEWAKSKWGSSVKSGRRVVDSQNEAGIRRLRSYGTYDAFTLDFEFLNSTDLTTLKSLWDNIANADTGAVKPLWVHYFYDEATTLRFVWWLSDFEMEYATYSLYRVAGLSFEEVAKTRI